MTPRFVHDVAERLPAPVEPSRTVPWGSYAVLETEPEEPSIPPSHYLWLLKWHRWKILAFVLVVTAATLLVSLRLTPIYESTATLDVDRQAPAGVIGPEAVRESHNDADQFLATQISLIQSDSVLRPVARQYRLVELEKQFQSLRGLSFLQRAEWAPEWASEAPILLKRLRIVRPPNTYLLQVSYRSPDARLASEVANAVTSSYLEHAYNLRLRSSTDLATYMEKEMDGLKAKMESSTERLVQWERELNVINPEEKTNILSARLLQLNTEYTAAQADRVRREAAYRSIRDGSLAAAQASTQGEALKHLSERENEAQEKFAQVKEHFGANHPEYKKAGAQLAEVQILLDRTRQNVGQRVEIEYREAASREGMLEQAVAKAKNEFDRLNARSFEYQAVKRDAEADKKLYEELVRKIREAGINASFQSSAIRVADPARPAAKPVFPRVQLNLAFAILLSSLIAAAAVIIADGLDKTVRDPEQAARVLKTEVIGSLPSVKRWRRKQGAGTPDRGRASLALAGAASLGAGSLRHRGVSPDEDPTPARRQEADDAQASGYGEAIRTLRNSILLTGFDRRVRSLLVTSAAPGEGKSTIAAYLATTHAGQRRRTLLIDGDLRRPTVHKRFHLPGSMGLSNVLASELAWRDALLKAPIPELDILPAGPPSRFASDLIGRGLVELLEEAAAEYDLVVLDAPPLLGFAEPLQMATAVDAVVVVARAGETDRKAVASVLATLSRLRANVLGLVLNEVNQEMSYHYQYGYHGVYSVECSQLRAGQSSA
ncbi:MAG TPA: polysaccharide biosynthesis tyrosine autokinase [Bryobacteraceae bacterium]|nr:polysaccharide biosynthesis tyrosine autokinase [Bryobacteraceae bacterium]